MSTVLRPPSTRNATSAPPQARKPLPHARGTCSCRITINRVAYRLRPIPIDRSIGTVAYSLTKHDGAVYHLHLSTYASVECDCPDAEFRRKDGSFCKHAAALRSLGFFGPATSPPTSRPADLPADGARLGMIPSDAAETIARTSLVGHQP